MLVNCSFDVWIVFDVNHCANLITQLNNGVFGISHLHGRCAIFKNHQNIKNSGKFKYQPDQGNLTLDFLDPDI